LRENLGEWSFITKICSPVHFQTCSEEETTSTRRAQGSLDATVKFGHDNVLSSVYTVDGNVVHAVFDEKTPG
jgi:hypothetical protein